MTIFAKNLFQGTPGTNIGTITPAVGGTPTAVNTRQAVIDNTSERARNGGTQVGAMYYLTGGTTTNPDYTIKAQFTRVDASTAFNASIYGRASTDLTAYYYELLVSGTTARVSRNGANIGSTTITAAGQNVVVELELTMTGSGASVAINAVVRYDGVVIATLTPTDTDVARNVTPGRVGWRITDSAVPADAPGEIGMRILEITATDTTVPPAGPSVATLRRRRLYCSN